MRNDILLNAGFTAACLAIIAFVLHQPFAREVRGASEPPVLYVEAGSPALQAGINGFELTAVSDSVVRIDVQSDTRGAEILLNDDPSNGVSAIAVNVSGSGETLLLSADSWSGSVSVNGNVVATWSHVEDDHWVFTNFGQLWTFTSWNILVDVWSDENLRDALPEALLWIGVLSLIVATAILSVAVVTLRNSTLQNMYNHNATCASMGGECADAGYDPTHPSCVYWFEQCGNGSASVYDQWCENLLDDCYFNNNQASCDLHNEHCP